MAQYIIRDSKGRVEKILNDKEYAEHQKTGCLTKIFLFIISIIVVIAIAINGDNSKNKDTNYYYSTKQNKKINFIYLPNNNTNKKKSQPYSPKAISITERNTSPLNNIETKLKIKQSFTSKDLCKNNSNIAKKSNDKIKLNLNKIIKKGKKE